MLMGWGRGGLPFEKVGDARPLSVNSRILVSSLFCLVVSFRATSFLGSLILPLSFSSGGGKMRDPRNEVAFRGQIDLEPCPYWSLLGFNPLTAKFPQEMMFFTVDLDFWLQWPWIGLNPCEKAISYQAARFPWGLGAKMHDVLLWSMHICQRLVLIMSLKPGNGSLIDFRCNKPFYHPFCSKNCSHCF